MPIEQITELFKWMTIINSVFFFLSLLVTIFLKKRIFKIHSKVFDIEEKQVSKITYSLFGIFKVAILMFNFVPYLTLLIIQ